MNHRVPLYYTLICTELCRLCLGSFASHLQQTVTEVSCWSRQCSLHAAAPCCNTPLSSRRCQYNPSSSLTLFPLTIQILLQPLSWNGSKRLETKLATQKAPASAPSGGLPNIRMVRSWSKNGKSSENRVDGASPALAGGGRKGNYNTAEVCLKTYWFVLVSQRQIWWKIWLQIVFTAPGDNLTPSTLSTQMQNCSFGLVWPLVYRESYYPSTPFPPFQSRSSLRTIHNLILSELVMAYLCCSYQTITNQQFPLTRKWGWSILAQNLCLPSFSLTLTFSVLGCYVPKRQSMNRIK